MPYTQPIASSWQTLEVSGALSRQDQFALAAMQVLLKERTYSEFSVDHWDRLAFDAYGVADEMEREAILRQREKADEGLEKEKDE